MICSTGVACGVEGVQQIFGANRTRRIMQVGERSFSRLRALQPSSGESSWSSRCWLASHNIRNSRTTSKRDHRAASQQSSEFSCQDRLLGWTSTGLPAIIRGRDAAVPRFNITRLFTSLCFKHETLRRRGPTAWTECRVSPRISCFMPSAPVARCRAAPADSSTKCTINFGQGVVDLRSDAGLARWELRFVLVELFACA